MNLRLECKSHNIILNRIIYYLVSSNINYHRSHLRLKSPLIDHSKYQQSIPIYELPTF